MSRPALVASDAVDHRCACGSLLARLSAHGVELKCRRCKRVVVIPWSTQAAWHGFDVSWESAPDPGT
jgi:hypothetical protein